MAESSLTAATATPPDHSESLTDPIVWPSQDEATLLATAQTHWTAVVQAESAWRAKAEDDQRFGALEHWPEVIKEQRDRDRRPCLVIDRLGTHQRQIVNEARQHRPGIIVSAVDDQADPETAKKIRGLIRDIEQQSNADIAYSTAMAHMVGPGRGFCRVVPVYTDDYSFKQELRILPIRNLFSVYLDPAHVMPDGSDANWAFVVTRLAKDAYEQTYRKLPHEAGAWAAEGDDWFNGTEVQVAEYWWREWHPLELALLESGEVKPVPLLAPEEHATIRKTRTTRIPQVWQAKINGHEVLEQTQWLGRYIPIAQGVGELFDLNGEVDYRGLTRRGRGPQMAVDFMETAKAELIALMPKSPWVAAWGQIEPFQAYWNTAHTTNFPYLPFEPVQIGGTVLPPPQRSAVEPPVQALVQASMMANDDIKAISGYHDQVQDQDPAISGEAIRRRQQSTNTASFHFQDNHRMMVRHLGRILVDAIPHYYDEPQTIRILGEDDQPQQVTLNKKHINEDGKEVIYDVTVGRYDVRIDGGPSYATKREEAEEKLGRLLVGSEYLQPLMSDVYVGSMDVDYAHMLSERIKKTMPPELLEGEPGAQKYAQTQQALQMRQQLPQLMEQMKQQQAQLQQMQQALQSMTMDNQQLRLAVQNKDHELALKARLEQHKLQLQAAEQAHEERMAELELQVQRFEAQTDRLKVQSNGNGVT